MTGTLVILSMLKCCELVTNYFPFFLVMPSAACYNLLILLRAFLLVRRTHTLHEARLEAVSLLFKKSPKTYTLNNHPSMIVAVG